MGLADNAKLYSLIHIRIVSCACAQVSFTQSHGTKSLFLGTQGRPVTSRQYYNLSKITQHCTCACLRRAEGFDVMDENKEALTY